MNIVWLFQIAAQSTTYYWSTAAYSYGGNIYQPLIDQSSFSGITMSRASDEMGIVNPSDLSFTILSIPGDLQDAGGATIFDEDDAYIQDSAPFFETQFNNQIGIVRLIIDGVLTRTWAFKTKRCEIYYGKATFWLESLISSYLIGQHPIARHPREIWPDNRAEETKDTYVVPVVFGDAYVPVRSVFTGTNRYYVLGVSGPTFTVSEVQSPKEWQVRSTWSSGSYSFNQSTDNGYRLLQPIIADSDGDNVADSSGVWKSGDVMLDMPCRYTSTAISATSGVDPSDVIGVVIQQFGIPAEYIGDFSAATSQYLSWGIEWDGGFYEQIGREQRLSDLLRQCNSSLRMTGTIDLVPRNVTSQATITRSEIVSGSFSYRPVYPSQSDGGHISWVPSGTPQDRPQDILCWSNSEQIDDSDITAPESTTLDCSLVKDSQIARKCGIISFNRLLDKSGINQFQLLPSASLVLLNPDDVITIDDDIYGESRQVLINSININKDLVLDIEATEYAHGIIDFDTLAPSAIIVQTDTTTPAFEIPTEISPLANIKANIISFSTTSNGYAYIHGYDSHGNATDTDGKVAAAGSVVSIPRVESSSTWTVKTSQTYDGYIVLDTALTGKFTVSSAAHSVVFAKKESNQWYYDNGSAWTTFTSTATDVVIGTLSRSATTITSANLYNGAASTGAIENQDAEAIALKNSGWMLTSTFSASDLNTVSWGSGTFTLADGSTYAISAGNTGNMGGKTYIYHDQNSNPTTLKTTVTAASSVGTGKTLVGVAHNTTTLAWFFIFGGSGGQNITGDFIAARSIAANNIVLNSLTASEINTGSINLSEWAGDLDDIDDGAYGKVLSTYISAGKITLSEAIDNQGGLATQDRSDLNYTDGADPTGTTITNGVTLSTGSLNFQTSSVTKLSVDGTNKKLWINNSTFGDDGIQIEYNGGNPRFYAGNGTTQFIEFDGTDLSIGGSVTATSGTIGGFTVGATSLIAGTGGTTVALDSGGINPAIYAGSSTPSTAPFRVTKAGALTATNAVITGVITIEGGSGGYANIGGIPTALSDVNSTEGTKLSGISNGADVTSSAVTSGVTLSTGSLNFQTSSVTKLSVDGTNKKLWINNSTFGDDGIQIEYNGGNPRFYAGNGTTQFIEFDGTDLSIGGEITATTGEIGGWNIGSTTLSAGDISFDSGNTRIQAGPDASNYVRVSPDGIVGVSETLGTVFTLPTDGSPPTFASGEITATSFTVSSAGVIETSENAGNGSTAGVRINNTGIKGWNNSTSTPKFHLDAATGVVTATDAILSGTVTATTGAIGGFTVGATSLTAGSGATTVALDSGGTNPAIYVGSSTPLAAPFRVTNAGVLTATGATITGTVTAIAGEVGGWNINTTSLTAGTGATTVGLDVGGTNPAIYAGSSTPSTAPFRVTQAGALTATSATITGTITSTSGTIGGFTVGATSLTAGTGSTTVAIDSGGTNPAIYAGSSTPSTAPFRVTKDGAVTASSIAITGGSISTTPITVSSAGVIETSATAGNGSTAGVRINDTGIKGWNNSTGTPTFYLNSSTGVLTATDAILSGAITATTGTVGGFTVGATDGLYAGTGTSRVQMKPGEGVWTGATAYADAKNGLKNDGSGKLASGNFTWDTSGNVTAAGSITSTATITGGTVQTAASGARSVLNSSGLAIYDVSVQRAKIGSDGAGWFGASDKLYWTSAGVLKAGGWTISETSLTSGTGTTTVGLDVGGINPAIYAGSSTPSTAPFRVTQAGALTATNATITGTVTATVGEIGGWTLGSTTLTGTSMVLTNTGDITAGTGDDVVRVSSSDGTYRLWAGDATAGDAPFRVDKDGAITSTSGTIGGWTIGSDLLQSAASGARVVLDKTKNRMSIFDADSETVVMGYLSGIVRNNATGTATGGGTSILTDTNKSWAIDELAGLVVVITSGTGSGQSKTIASNTATVITISGTFSPSPDETSVYEVRYTSADYGFWAKDGDTLNIDGDVTYESGDWIVQNNGSLKILDGSGNEIVRLGTDTSAKGLFIYNTTGDTLAEYSSSQIMIGDGSNKYFKYDGTNISWKAQSSELSAAGALTATAGAVGGWNINTTSLTAGTGATTVGLDVGGTNPAIYAGSSTPSTAPFRVTQAGALTATSATITGTVTATEIYGSSLSTAVSGSTGERFIVDDTTHVSRYYNSSNQLTASHGAKVVSGSHYSLSYARGDLAGSYAYFGVGVDPATEVTASAFIGSLGAAPTNWLFTSYYPVFRGMTRSQATHAGFVGDTYGGSSTYGGYAFVALCGSGGGVPFYIPHTNTFLWGVSGGGIALSSTIGGTRYTVVTNNSFVDFISKTVVASSSGTSDTIISATASATTGSTIGIGSTNASTSGKVISAVSSASTGTTYGVYTTNASTAGTGVYALASSASGTAIYGEASETGTGTTYGIKGSVASSLGVAVKATSSKATGTNYAFYGTNASTSGVGLYAGATATGAGTSYGVFGECSTQTGVAGRFISNATTGSNYGVAGGSYSSTGCGTAGFAFENSGVNFGVTGNSASASGFDFYATGSGTNYGPFTGGHQGLVTEDFVGEIGDIVCDYQVVNKANISNCICEMVLSSTPKQKSARGVMTCSSSTLNLDQLPAGLNGYTGDLKDYGLINFNAVGEGQINVCPEGGNIEIGDKICTSSIPGKGMKLTLSSYEDILYIVAESRENVDWAIEPESTKMIACIYHKG